MTAGARPRGVYSMYKSTRVSRLHVIRDAWMDASTLGRERTRIPAGSQTLCGQHAWGTLKAPATVLDPLPAAPPQGLTWCPTCLGLLAERLGVLDRVGRWLTDLRWPTPPEQGSRE